MGTYNNKCGRGEMWRGHCYCQITGAWCGYLSDDCEDNQDDCKGFLLVEER